MIKNRKGITLVALIVTIIILLILAGVTIAQLTGNGLFEKAKLAKEKSENAQELEDETLIDYENKIEKEISSSNRENEDIKIQKTMSYEEHFTGEYYLDGKPIYAKTINCGNYPNRSRTYVTHNAENYENIWIDMSNSYAISDNYVIPCVYLNENPLGLGTYIQGDNIVLVSSDDRTNCTGIITVKYTKATD